MSTHVADEDDVENIAVISSSLTGNSHTCIPYTKLFDGEINYRLTVYSTRIHYFLLGIC